MTFVVAGATGHVGRAVVAALTAKGVPVRALVRSAGKQFPAGVEVAVADLDRPETVNAALEGAAGLFCCPVTPTCRAS